MTQKDVASKLNISRKTISSWENNKSVPSIDFLKEITSIYNVSLNELTGEINSYNNYNNKTNEKESAFSKITMEVLFIMNIIFILLCIINLITNFIAFTFPVELIIILSFYSVYIYKHKVLKINNKYIFIILFLSLLIFSSLQIHKLYILHYDITLSLVLGAFVRSIAMTLGIRIIFVLDQI